MIFGVWNSKRWKSFCAGEIQAKATYRTTIEPITFEILSTPSAFVEYDVRLGQNNVERFRLLMIRCVGFRHVGVWDDNISFRYDPGFRVPVGERERMLEMKRVRYLLRTLVTTTVELHIADGAVILEVILFPHSDLSTACKATERKVDRTEST